MTDPILGGATQPAIRGLTPATQGSPAGTTQAAAGRDFKSFLADSLNEVNALQAAAQDGVEKLLTGQTDNTAEVLTAIRKADVAFSLLTEIRNKLMDVYTELKQMRV